MIQPNAGNPAKKRIDGPCRAPSLSALIVGVGDADCFQVGCICAVFGEIENNDDSSFEVLDSIRQGDIIESMEIKEERD